MPKFEDKFVYFRWSDELEGKKVLYADHIDKLEELVVNICLDYFGVVQKSVDTAFPFEVDFNSWQFCYYDPYYELKLAYEQGKTIQAILPGNIWVNIEEPSWVYRPEDYRIKPDEPEKSKPVTNRELARWLAQGNGEHYEYDCDGWESHRCIEYQYEQDNLPVSGVMVRKWEDEEWHQPTREYMGLEE